MQNYGIDFDGPTGCDRDVDLVEVPEVHVETPAECTQLIESHEENDPNSCIELYLQVLEILSQI